MDEVVAIAYKLWVVLLLDNDQQVARNTTLTSSVTLATHRDSHTITNASRNLNLDNLLTLNGTLARTLIATLLDYLARTTTSGADTLGLHTAKEGVLHRNHIARTVTSRASGVCR